jgi:release factor glutamine methyltransferase
VAGERSSLAARLARAGFVAADEEAGELLARAGGDGALLERLVVRRLSGEPLAWIVGGVTFCDVEVRVDPGVYVPRPQTEAIALEAVALLPDAGVAVDLCTGSGAVAVVLAARRPGARVVACDVDPRAVACARANGVEVYEGDLFAPLPAELAGRVGVVAGVVPYVPHADLPLLQRDTLTFESAFAYDGGPDGTDVLRRALREAARWLRDGGALVLELGGGEAELLRGELRDAGYRDVRVLADEDGDVRGISARRP